MQSWRATYLLLGSERVAAADKPGWSQPRFLREATGREPLDEAEATQIEQLGIRWLALGRHPSTSRR